MIIGLSGGAGQGKDTAADFLIEKYGFEKISFSESLYDEVSKAFGVSVEDLKKRETKEKPVDWLSLDKCKDLEFVKLVNKSGDPEQMFEPRSPRFILQQWGTDYRRAQNEDYWVNKVRDKIKSNPNKDFVTADVRFENEAKTIINSGGIIAKVHRKQAESVLSHVSEMGIDERYIATHLMNDRDIPFLEAQVSGLYFQYDQLKEEVLDSLNEIKMRLVRL